MTNITTGYTQKEMVKNLIETMSNETAMLAFVYLWLEDINWHTECNLFTDKISDADQARIQALQELDYCLRPYKYCLQFATDFLDNLDPTDKQSIERYTQAIKLGQDVSIEYCGYEISANELRDFRKAIDAVSIFSAMTSWGLDNSFVSNRGIELVDDLYQIIQDRVNAVSESWSNYSSYID